MFINPALVHLSVHSGVMTVMPIYNTDFDALLYSGYSFVYNETMLIILLKFKTNSEPKNLYSLAPYLKKYATRFGVHLHSFFGVFF